MSDLTAHIHNTYVLTDDRGRHVGRACKQQGCLSLFTMSGRPSIDAEPVWRMQRGGYSTIWVKVNKAHYARLEAMLNG